MPRGCNDWFRTVKKLKKLSNAKSVGAETLNGTRPEVKLFVRPVALFLKTTSSTTGQNGEYSVPNKAINEPELEHP